MGQKSAVYNTATGAIIGYYDSIDSPLPATLPSGAASLDITDTEWQAGISSPYAPSVISGVYTIPTGPTLEQAKSAQIALLQASYQSSVNAPVTFKNAAGVTSTYPSGNTVLTNGMKASALLAQVIAAGSSAWTLDKWLDTNNVAQTFTFSDLQGLAGAMEAAITIDWSDLILKIDEVNQATSVSAVKAIVW